ncbi:alpha/beta hydrolase family protein [Diaminobutyricimonas aerilata]|uniref:Alpha/beta hydrolase family protein n=1 Tax=Diaminobutyricimonas aerilata TaxID=1162967 RepID=A0A2M9CGZ0_9MICO|nr:alpha/beta hydrolase [Diaminobutyricimonas aerilata]PJJ71132.1 alpha/beta hydrolase family protein [Diaminobutyricimonas aerilata]
MRARLALVLAVLVLAVGGCAALDPNPRSVSTPAPADVPAELEPFYTQVLEWEPCGSGFQCSNAEVPLDWADPAGDRIDLALLRRPAQNGDPQGSLLVNPGGPGASGVDFVRDSADYATGRPLQEAFDIVGFDPRGVGRSTPVECADEPEDLDEYLFAVPDAEPGTPDWYAESDELSADFGADCARYTGDLLAHVDTTSAARDLDVLRAVLGDEKLNYLGYSYGTSLGARYLELFPERAGRLVLDGALDPAASLVEVTASQAEGFEGALRAWLETCVDDPECVFHGDSVDEAAERIRSLLDRLAASPLRADDGRELGNVTMFTAIILPLYNRANWPALSELFTSVLDGDTGTALALADEYYGRGEDGVYLDNAAEAQLAVNCLDFPSTIDPVQREAEAQAILARAPVFGREMAYGMLSCARWPVPPTGERAPLDAPTAPGVIVVGTTGDPATPYAWAQALADQLPEGILVTFEGEGHTAYNKSNECVDSAVETFLVEGELPRADVTC